MKTQRAYGSWPSSISTDMVIKGSPKLQETTINNGRIFWLQTLPDEKGRVSIMSYDGSQIQSILPRPLSAKSKVHEYGGGSYLIDDNMVYFVLADDQRIYAAEIGSTSATAAFSPTALIPENDERQLRFADLRLDRTHNRLIAVCEEHRSDTREPLNYLAAIDLNGSGTKTLVEGCDFYASPAISPCGKWLCWLSWNHPNMPWDATQLWLAAIQDNGELSTPRLIAGNGNESLFQPRWSPDGDLFFVSDRNNWWNIYRYAVRDTEISQVTFLEAEFATPQWTFNMSTYAFLNSNTIIATYSRNGRWFLASIDISDPANAVLKNIETEVTSIYGISAADHHGAFIGASEDGLPAIYRYNEKDSPSTNAINPLPLEVGADDVSRPNAITFTTTRGEKAYGYFYPPANADYHNNDARPPLIVTCHGGPTGATENSLDLKIQYWTNRGFAVLDVNYRGSTGYGRNYRQLLYKNWGIYDVDDVCAAAEYAVAQGWADPERLIIKGSSAGGYTVLAALTFRDTFKVGVSLYGIGDLDTLVQDTHKFEAKYLDKLVGDYEREHDLYEQRSPINYTEKLSCPLLVFQGLEDKVVPPNQAIKMVDAVKQKGLPVAYVEYADEAHGFRNSRNIAHMLKAEQYFYGRIFDIPLPGELKDFIPIFNL